MESIKLKINNVFDGRVVIGSEENHSIADVWGGHISGIEDTKGLARRMAAAWNYCAGVPTEKLEASVATEGLCVGSCPTVLGGYSSLKAENAALRAAVKEMQLMLPVIEKAEDMGNGGVWATLTAGTGIATPNAYRYALEKALAKINENK